MLDVGSSSIRVIIPNQSPRYLWYKSLSPFRWPSWLCSSDCPSSCPGMSSSYYSNLIFEMAMPDWRVGFHNWKIIPIAWAIAMIGGGWKVSFCIPRHMRPPYPVFWYSKLVHRFLPSQTKHNGEDILVQCSTTSCVVKRWTTFPDT